MKKLKNFLTWVDNNFLGHKVFLFQTDLGHMFIVADNEDEATDFAFENPEIVKYKFIGPLKGYKFYGPKQTQIFIDKNENSFKKIWNIRK